MQNILFKAARCPPPASPTPAPQTAPACSRQEQTGLSERQRSARTRGSHAAEQTLVCPQDCIVGIASALHSATNEVETGMQACSRAAAEMRRRTTCTHSRACTHTHIHTHSQAHTHTGAHTHTRTDTHAQAHIGAHTHRHTHSLAPLHTHTYTHTLATAPKQHAKLAHACSSSSRSDSKVATHKPPGLQKSL